MPKQVPVGPLPRDLQASSQNPHLGLARTCPQVPVWLNRHLGATTAPPFYCTRTAVLHHRLDPSTFPSADNEASTWTPALPSTLPSTLLWPFTVSSQALLWPWCPGSRVSAMRPHMSSFFNCQQCGGLLAVADYTSLLLQAVAMPSSAPCKTSATALCSFS